LPAGIGCSLNNAYQPLYRPDSVWNYEVGAKTEFLERRLSVDIALYRIDWKNVQQALTDPGCGYLFVGNVGTARSKGAEVEINLKPTQNLLFTLSGTYTSAQYDSIDGPFQRERAVQQGDAVRDIPRPKVNIGGEYTKPVGTFIGYANVDWTHQGSVPTGFTYKDVRPAYNALEAALGLRRGAYDVSLYGHNLTNSTGIVSIQQSSVYSYGSVFKSEVTTPPRTIGVDLKMHF
jgi:outer membrane receptor protein involved in Fe transport